jgi:hypothetical protein
MIVVKIGTLNIKKKFILFSVLLKIQNFLNNFCRHRKDLGTKIRAKSLTTDPESKSKTFLLLGSAVSDHDTPDDGSSYNRHFTFRLDFSNLFDRDCNRNEFDDWVLARSGFGSGSNCFMGKEVNC